MDHSVQRSEYNLNLLANILNLLHSLMDLMENMGNLPGRRWWVRPTNVRRQQQGAANNLLREMRHYDEEEFFNFTRLTIAQFDGLLRIVGPSLRKHSIRPAIPPESRLFITLRYLATGDSFTSLHFLYRVGYSTINKIILETCDEIYNSLKSRCIPRLDEDTFLDASAGFQGRTRFPHVIGAIDGKHIAIRKPPRSASRYYNYKKYFSIVLLGVCDNRYKFIYFNVGGYGSESDGGIYRNSELLRGIENGTIQLPPPSPTSGSNFNVPFVFLGDAAFPLRTYLMTPYGGRILSEAEIKYNFELSRGRSAIENVRY